MDQLDFNTFCSSLPATTHVVQWGGHDVWKVGGKVFAVASFDPDDGSAISFKCSDISFEILREQPGLRPAPYLASRGAPWIQDCNNPGLSDDDLKAYLAESHRIIGAGLTKKKQRELGLLAD